MPSLPPEATLLPKGLKAMHEAPFSCASTLILGSLGGALKAATLGPRMVAKLTPRVSKPDPPESRLDVLNELLAADDYVRFLLYSVVLLLSGFDFLLSNSRECSISSKPVSWT